MWEEAVLTNLNIFSELHLEKYVPHARRHIIQLHKSALQPSLAKPFAEMGRKIVPTLSWVGAVTKMAF